MNRKIALLAGVVMVLAACGRAPEPSATPSSAGSTDLPTSTATSASTALPSPPPPAGSPTSLAPPPVKSTARPPAPPPTTAQPPPAPPKPPDRWVLSSGDRRRLEQQTGASFKDFDLTLFWSDICPKHDVCVKAGFEVDASLGNEDVDCYVGRHVIPDPLFEGGTVTWVVNNPCDPA